MPKQKDQNKYNLRSRKTDEEKRKRRGGESSDDDDSEWEEGAELDQSYDQKEYKKFLHKLFPSKALKKEIEKMDEIDAKLDSEKSKKKNKKLKNRKIKKPKKEESEAEEEEDEEEVVEEKSSKRRRNRRRHSSKKKEESESEEEEEDDEEDDEEDYEDEEMDEDEMEELEQMMAAGGGKNFNIIFSIGAPGRGEEYDDEYDEDYEEEDSEDEYEDEEEEDEEDDESSENSEESNDKKLEKELKKMDKKITREEEEAALSKDLELIQGFEKMVADMRKSNKDSAALKEFEKMAKDKKSEYQKKKDKFNKKEKAKNVKQFRKLLRQKNPMNDVGFFQKLDPKKQEQILKDVEEINKIVTIDKPYRMKLLESDIPNEIKACAMKKIAALRYMEPGGGEFHKLKTWVDTFMQIPFGKHAELPVSLEKDGQTSCHDFMADAVKTLDEAVYGLNDAKMQIMQMVGQWLTNPQAVGNAIAIKGPPGTGKTTLVKYGISKILKRDFAFLALGGATDSSFLEGHSYTYEGSTWGKIVDILVQSNCMNPVIYFDELDKISDSPKGEEITGILTHLTDTTQNDKFHDKYFSEIEFDLSKCLFIFSYNDESKVNPILKDRMYRIETKGYESPQKLIIANKYLLPTIREQVKFDSKDITINDEAMKYIMSTFCSEEKGVRNLKRCLEIIHTKLNLYRLMKEGTNLFEEDLTLKVTFPVTVNREMIDKLIKKDKEPNWVSTLYI